MGGSSSKDASVKYRQGEVTFRPNSSQAQLGQEQEDEHLGKDESQCAPPPYTDVARTPSLSIGNVEIWERRALQDPKNRFAISALTTNSPASVLTSRVTEIKETQLFSIKIPLEGGPITNQRASGRCWLFASMNVFRVAMMKRYNLKELELSQSYLFFWDKLEKANYFLEQVVETANEEHDSRLIQALLASPVGDGGQWDMVASLVSKYGLVPHHLYPDTYSAMNSSAMDRIITTKLRENALELRALASKHKSRPEILESAIASTKTRMLQEVHLIITLSLGAPPSPSKTFEWEYLDKDDHFVRHSITPLELAQTLSDPTGVRACAGTDVNRLFSLIHDPRNDYLQLLSVSRLGNVIGGQEITYVNVDIATMKKACIKMLRRGLPVFFGCDSGKASDPRSGVMDVDLVDYELGFNVRLGMSKQQRLQTGESRMTHAMVLTGVHIVNGSSLRWRVQNSWGPDAGTDGFFVMSDRWMDEFVYQAVVDPAFVSNEVRDVLDQPRHMLPLWDPMGALA